jgi:hypothetical protein
MSATMKRGVLERGRHAESAGHPPLGELLWHGCRSSTGGATNILTVLGATLMPFTSQNLQERISEEGENMIGMLEGKG